MARYSDGVTEAMVGDVVKCSIEGCACNHTEFEVESIVHDSDIHLLRERYPFPASNFEFIRRAPAPEPDQPAVKNERPEQPMSEPLVKDSVLITDLQQAWKHAVRAVNYCENADMNDTATAVREIVVKLSQQLEFHQAQSGVI